MSFNRNNRQGNGVPPFLPSHMRPGNFNQGVAGQQTSGPRGRGSGPLNPSFGPRGGGIVGSQAALGPSGFMHHHQGPAFGQNAPHLPGGFGGPPAAPSYNSPSRRGGFGGPPPALTYNAPPRPTGTHGPPPPALTYHAPAVNTPPRPTGMNGRPSAPGFRAQAPHAGPLVANTPPAGPPVFAGPPAFAGLPSVDSWGAMVPGRPPTPSEGHAQTYTRFGPLQQQAIRTFDNGTTLQYGPDDLIEEFEPHHPFFEQILQIDQTVRAVQLARARHEGTQEGLDRVFTDFRTRSLSCPLPNVELGPDVGTYVQTRSQNASVHRGISYFNTTVLNESQRTWPSTTGRDGGVDTRYGVTIMPEGTDQALARVALEQGHTDGPFPEGAHNLQNPYDDGGHESEGSGASGGIELLEPGPDGIRQTRSIGTQTDAFLLDAPRGPRGGGGGSSGMRGGGGGGRGRGNFGGGGKRNSTYRSWSQNHGDRGGFGRGGGGSGVGHQY